jgi:DNA-binding GntR family transcriptional regulator
MSTVTRSRVKANGGSRAGPGGSATTRTHRIRASVERAIVSGRLSPGSKLDENALAERYGASRTPVREALQQLASQGLIELRANAGAFVATLTAVDLAEMFETMACFEAACAALAARRHTATDRPLLTAAHDACAQAARRNDPVGFYRANGRFHQCIYAASHNGYLAARTLELGKRLEAYRRAATFHPGLMSLTMHEHECILRAIFSMDEDAAARHMRGHLDTLRDDAVSVARATRVGRQ